MTALNITATHVSACHSYLKTPARAIAHSYLKTLHKKAVHHVIKHVHHSRGFFECATCLLTAIDTHTRALTVVCIVWAIIDFVLILAKEEL